MAALVLTRPKRLRGVITLAPMIDILMILLVFFMVTSSFLDLDMIPAVAGADSTATHSASDGTTSQGATSKVLLIRLGSDGIPTLRGQPMMPEALRSALTQALSDSPELQVIVLPSASVPMQALVRVLDGATTAGVSNLQIVRLDPR